MKQLPGEGYKSIDVLCPAFSADCLETIEEISGENKEYFEEHGGERFQYIPCLNDRPDHISFLADLLTQHAQGWPETDPNPTKPSSSPNKKPPPPWHKPSSSNGKATNK